MVETQLQTKSTRLIPEETKKLVVWANQIKHKDITAFEKARKISKRLGAHYRRDGLTEIGFWVPALGANLLQSKNIHLEVLTPQGSIDPTQKENAIGYEKTY